MRSSPFWPRATQPLLQVAYRHAASPVGLLDGPEVGDTFSRGGSGPGRGVSQDIHSGHSRTRGLQSALCVTKLAFGVPSLCLPFLTPRWLSTPEGRRKSHADPLLPSSSVALATRTATQGSVCLSVKWGRHCPSPECPGI